MLEIKKPETIYISFNGNMPKYFELFDIQDNKPYYFRYLDGKTPRIKFNITHEGCYNSNCDIDIVKRESIKTPFNLPELPTPDRSRVKNVEIVINEWLKGTPLCIYTEDGCIEVSSEFLEYPKQIQGYLLFHEYAHLLYSDEHCCDLFALVACLRKGYNRSMCFYALSEKLSKSPENIRRMIKIFDKIQVTQKEPLLWQNYRK